MTVIKEVVHVASWELRHFSANRFNWAISGAAFVFFTGLMLVRHQWGGIMGTTTLGQLLELVNNLMLIFGIMLPFLVTDRIAHDYQERMHELLMTTAIPSSIYVLGRYLASLLISAGLAMLLLAAQLLVNRALPLINAQFPPADPITTFSLWGRLALPVSMLIGSLCFCFGTLFPRATAIPKLVICIAWIILALDNDPTDITWRAYWNPTGAGMVTLTLRGFQNIVETGTRNILGAAQQAEMILRVQQMSPDYRPWIGPFGALVLIGLCFGILAMIGFRRFRNCMNG